MLSNYSCQTTTAVQMSPSALSNPHEALTTPPLPCSPPPLPPSSDSSSASSVESSSFIEDVEDRGMSGSASRDSSPSPTSDSSILASPILETEIKAVESVAPPAEATAEATAEAIAPVPESLTEEEVDMERANLKQLWRRSLEGSPIPDPDLPVELEAAMQPPQSSNDASTLFWVPASLHPELNPNGWKSFLDNQVSNLKNSEAVISAPNPTARSNTLRRRRSLLSHQINPEEGASSYHDAAPFIQEQNVERSRSLKLSELERVETLARNPSIMRSLVAELSNGQNTGANSSAGEDQPLLLVPSQFLQRSSRTTIRRSGASIRTVHRGKASLLSSNSSQRATSSSGTVGDTKTTTPTDPAAPATIAHKDVSPLSKPAEQTTQEVEPEPKELTSKPAAPIIAPQPIVKKDVPKPICLSETPKQASSTIPKSYSSPNLRASLRTPPPIPQRPVLTHTVGTHSIKNQVSSSNPPSSTTQPITQPLDSKKPKKSWGRLFISSEEEKEAKKDKSKKKGKNAESSSSSESGHYTKKDKDATFLNSLFGNKKKSSQNSPTSNVTTPPPVPKPKKYTYSGNGKRKDSSKVNEPLKKENPKNSSFKTPHNRTNHQQNWSRFPIYIERAIYRLSHIKLSNPRRPLLQQVLLSNFMYSYLDLISKTNTASIAPGIRRKAVGNGSSKQNYKGDPNADSNGRQSSEFSSDRVKSELEILNNTYGEQRREGSSKASSSSSSSASKKKAFHSRKGVR